ncbi:MAG: Uma2 family endonuclease [Byssovorax sp.]
MDRHASTAQAQAFSYRSRLYVRAPRPIHFPSEESPEEHVSETKRHLIARTTLFLLLEEALARASVGSEQFVYWDATDPKKCLSPDAFVKLGSKDRSFDTWKIWERRAPDLAVEIVGDSDSGDSAWEVKLARYQASGIGEVVRFDPESATAPLRVWDRVDGDLIERSPGSAMLRECAALDLWWAVVPSELGAQLRLAHDREGQKLLPTPSEERVRLAEELAQERKARSEAEHERMVAEQKLLAEQKTRELAERARDAAVAELARLRGR